uniref:Uncharacterized protein n=1 Tax=Opuntia streptacantha TaxID=393608 RepID=A0A7C9AH92_OPUST
MNQTQGCVISIFTYKASEGIFVHFFSQTAKCFRTTDWHYESNITVTFNRPITMKIEQLQLTTAHPPAVSVIKVSLPNTGSRHLGASAELPFVSFFKNRIQANL